MGIFMPLPKSPELCDAVFSPLAPLGLSPIPSAPFFSPISTLSPRCYLYILGSIYQKQNLRKKSKVP